MTSRSDRGRKKAVPIDSLADYERHEVTIRQLADYLGVSARTLRYHCRHGLIRGARRRGIKPESEWLIPKDEALRLEHEAGLTVKHHSTAA